MRPVRLLQVLALALLLAWVTLLFWNSGKPMPPGTHIVSAFFRMSESDIDFLSDAPRGSAVLPRQLAAMDRAEQMIVLDQSPLGAEAVRHLLARKHLRPNLRVIVITDPANEVFGGTPAEYLAALERAGIMVARVRLDRLRDSNPLYSSLWRLCLGWWSDPFDEIPGKITLPAWLRRLNFKSAARQVLVADDGSGGWVGIVAAAPSESNAAMAIRGSLARDIAASELRVAGWSADDDRLPTAPPMGGRGVGSIDARFLTEGAIATALLDALAAAQGNDRIYVAASRLGERRVVDAILRAAARGIRVQVLLDPMHRPNPAVAGEMLEDGGGHVDVHWFAADRTPAVAGLFMVRHGNDLWVNLGSANFLRRDLNDLNLTAALELRLPARAAAARQMLEYFDASWSGSIPCSVPSDESGVRYWRYRAVEATGLSSY